ncbi:MAG: serine/threonine protein kinase, partial [Planctomycetales bacterium]|nr:serine/threonine protein kinase [Planctomycetales bacterium]
CRLVENSCIECGKTRALVDGVCTVCRNVDAPTIAPTLDSSNTDGTTRSPNVETPRKAFGEYELLEEIARGGMGVVYRARHLRLNRITALKMVLSGRFSSDEEIRRFHIEAESAASLDHPGIVPVYEIGDVDGQAFFAMKFIPGGSLAEHIAELCQAPQKAMQILSKVARAVHHAHQRGVLHRDLKPANILLDEGHEPRVTDLGLAKNTKGDSQLTNTGAVMGTPSYMAPEQAAGGSVTTAADVYSLGAIMYQLLTGTPPHKGESAMETVMRVVAGPPDPPSRVRRDVDRNLEAICMKCLAYTPESRYGSALELATDLEAWAAGKPISVREPSLWARTKRWCYENSRILYTAFIVLTGILFTAPIAVAMFLVPDAWHRDVYSQFPEADTPWLFSWQVDIPDWLAAGSIFLLNIFLYPSLGLLTAILAKTQSLRHALATGVATAIILSVLISLLVGWIPLAGVLSNESSRVIEGLGKAVWLQEGESADAARQEALALFSGLDEIPVEKRAELVANRVAGDQFAKAISTMLLLILLVLLLSVPVVIGTAIAHVLLRRGNHFVFFLIRYFIAWWSVFMFAICMIGMFATGVRLNGEPVSESPLIATILLPIAAATAYLVMRRWSPARQANNSSSSLTELTRTL